MKDTITVVDKKYKHAGDGLYASKEGDIFCTKRMCVMKQWKTTNGYRVIYAEKRTLYAHRLVAKAWIPNPENKPEVNHKDLNKENNYLGNLEWVTSKENSRHAILNGVYYRKQWFTKLKDHVTGAIWTSKEKIDERTGMSIPVILSASRKNQLYLKRFTAWELAKTDVCPITDEEYLEYTRSDECPVYVIEHVWSKPIAFTSFHALASIADYNDERSAWAFITNAIIKGNIKRYKNNIQKLADWNGDRKDLIVAGDEGVDLEIARMKKPYLLGVEPNGKMTLYIDGHRRVPDMEESAVLRAVTQGVPTRWGRRYYVFATIDAMAKFLAQTYPTDRGGYSILKIGSNPMTCKFKVTAPSGEIYENEYARLSFFNKE